MTAYVIGGLWWAGNNKLPQQQYSNDCRSDRQSEEQPAYDHSIQQTLSYRQTRIAALSFLPLSRLPDQQHLQSALFLRSASKDDDACFDAHAPDYLQISGAGGWRDRRVQCELRARGADSCLWRAGLPGPCAAASFSWGLAPSPAAQLAACRPSQRPPIHIPTAAAVDLRHPGHPAAPEACPPCCHNPSSSHQRLLIPAEIPHSPWWRCESAQGTVCRHGQQVLRPGDLLLRVW